MLDEDERATSLLMAMPLMCAFQQYKKARLECDNDLRLENRSAGMFFRMSPEEKQMIKSFVRPTRQAQLFFDNNIAMTQEQLEEFNILDDDIRKEFIAGREIIIRDRTADKVLSCLFSGKLIVNTIACIFLYESVIGALYIGGLSRGAAMGLGIPVAIGLPLILCFVAYVSVDYLKMSSKKIKV